MTKFALSLTIIALVTMTSLQGILPGGGSSGCTRDHCYFCQTDGKDSWCSRCGNGKAINKIIGSDRTCEGDLTVENCREAPIDDPLNVDLCGRCQPGYFLESPTLCVPIELEGCDRPVKLTSDSPVTCEGCEGKFLKDDLSGCVDETDEEMPENCMYGDKVSTGKCKTCVAGWFPSVSGMSCEEERVTGCAIYHPNEPQKCFTCNTDDGYYAIKGEVDGDNTYQKCRFSGMTYVFQSALLLALVALFSTQM